ncbi:hypothetical protein P7C70_g1708, partial [Phenoliferia sp. Uapishka_3]
MSTTSMPQPLDPKIPTSSLAINFSNVGRSGSGSAGSFSMAAAEGGEEARGRRGHPAIPIRIHVLILAAKIHALLVDNFASKKKDASSGGGSGGGGGYGHPLPTYPDTSGWRGDFTSSASAPPPQQSPLRQQNHSGYSNGGYGSNEQQPGSTAAYGGYSGAAQQNHVGYAPSPPRRGHVMTESSVGVADLNGGGAGGGGGGYGGEFKDRRLDSLIGAAAGRRKNKGE